MATQDRGKRGLHSEQSGNVIAICSSIPLKLSIMQDKHFLIKHTKNKSHHAHLL